MKTLVHHTPDRNASTTVPDPHQDVFSTSVLGFWMYLMSDCLLFATLFATYAVLHNSTFGGPSGKDLFSLTTAFAETMILLTSSVTCGFAVLATYQKATRRVLGWLAVTFVLGASFIFLELHEFYEMVSEGNSWTRSAFLSAFFALVGTHGMHVSVGLLWIAVMIGQVAYKGITTITFKRLVLFSMFWHFLDLIWIFIFSLVYLFGVA
jgi:cytochrome o ubiquinol oxidase subunit 3